MKNEKTATKSEISFAKQVFSNKLFLTGVGGLLVFVLLSFIYLYNPRYVPTLFKSTADIVGDTIVGKDLAETIDATRDESGATSIRTIFNTNKEQNLEKHCEKKEENGQVQEKCYKTYENEEFGYSVQYPEEWVTQELSENKRVIFSSTLLKEDTDQIAPIEVFVIKDTSIDEEIKQIKNETIRDYKEETILVGNIQAKKISGYMGLFFWGEANHTFVLYENNGNVYEWSGYTEDADIKSKFDAMISSIKFQ